MYRLVLWNIDLSLVDVVRVTRDACAEAFQRVTGRPLVALPRFAGQSDSEIFFDSLALNDVRPDQPGPADQALLAQELLARYTFELAAAFSARRDLLAVRGRLMPGALEALAGTAALPGVIQSVLTGTIRANATLKLACFGLDAHLDTDIGGYGSDVYPKGTELLTCRSRAAEKYGCELDPARTVYLGDSPRDVEAARIARARSIAVASGRQTAAELADAGADVVLADLADTAAVVAAIDQLTGAVPTG
jgi:phosphoglycolate phosphatase-like HAD superfamily hydrolase